MPLCSPNVFHIVSKLLFIKCQLDIFRLKSKSRLTLFIKRCKDSVNLYVKGGYFVVFLGVICSFCNNNCDKFMSGVHFDILYTDLFLGFL